MNTETIVKQTTSFRDDLLKDLTDTEFAMYYLEAALADYKADDNTESIWMALRDVVEAQAAISELSKRTSIDGETLSDIVCNEDTPRLDILNTIRNAFEGQSPVQHKTDANFRIKKIGLGQKFFAGKPVDQLKHNSTDVFPEDVPTNKSLLPLIGVIHSVQRVQRAACVATFSD